MSPQWIAFWVMLSVLVFFLIIAWIVRHYQLQRKQQAILNASTDATTLNNAYNQEYVGVAVWGINSPSSDTTRNACHLYQLQGTATTPANPSLSTPVLNNLTPTPVPGCYDLDQIVAAQVTHTCTAISGVTTPLEGTVGCISTQGARVQTGTSETYYTQSGLLQIAGGGTTSFACSTPACTGALSVLILNYFPNNGTTDIYDTAVCLSAAVGSPFTGQQCNLTDPSQLLRITRSPASVPGTSSSSSTTVSTTTSNDISLGKVGSLCSLFHRASGLYVDVDSGLTSLALSSNSSYIWALVRTMNGATLTSPQQIVYVGTLTAAQLAQFNSVLSFDSLIQLITSLGLLSIQLDGSTGNLILAPFYTYPVGTVPIPNGAIKASMYPAIYSIFPQVVFTTQPTNF